MQKYKTTPAQEYPGQRRAQMGGQSPHHSVFWWEMRVSIPDDNFTLCVLQIFAFPEFCENNR